MRIALTHAFCWPEVRRGAERFVPGLGAALARRGHEIVHYSAAWEPGTVVEDGVTTIRFQRRFRDDFRHEADFGLRLLPALARERFDAVHSLGRHDATASIRAARLRRAAARLGRSAQRRRDSRRTIVTDLGIPDRDWWREQGRFQARAAARVVREIDVYSAMSVTAVEALARSYGRADGVVVPGGVDLGEFHPSARRESEPTILFSGAIAELRKGVPVLLEALPLIAHEEPGVTLWLSGPGDPEPFLAQAPPEARERTRALGLGVAERQHERYGRAWVTCLPSTHDSFGMALVESLACGTPLVTTTHGAPNELVDRGVTGEVCEPGDPEDLARACLRAFALARRPETATACRRSAEPFDWDLGLAPLCERLYATGR